MAGPAAVVLVSWTEVVPSWFDLMSPFACDWRGDDFCWISDTRKRNGSYLGEPRPFVGHVRRLDPRCENEETMFRAFELSLRRRLTHEIELAAMCNQPEDHRVLGEATCAIAEQFGGVIDLGGNDFPIEECQMMRCSWLEEGREYSTVLCDHQAMRCWLANNRFHMTK